LPCFFPFFFFVRTAAEWTPVGPTKNLLADEAQEVASERDVAFAVR
jgi:hypothetical protein